MEKLKLEDLDIQSESLTDKLEEIEANLWIEDNITAISDDVRRMFMKIRSLDRMEWESSSKLSADYANILELYDSYLEQGITNIQDYYTFSQQMLIVLRDLKTEKGEVIVDMEIDGWWIEAAIALYEWAKKAIQKIYKELEWSVKLLFSPEEWKNLVLWLYEAAKNPKLLMENIVAMLKDYGGDIYRDFELLTENVTKKWYAVEMSQFVPETGIPLVLWLIGPGKFLKWLKILDKLPKWIARKLDWIVDSKTNTKLDTKPDKLVGIRAINFDMNMSLEAGAKFVENFSKYVDIDYLSKDPARFSHFINVTRKVTKYMEGNAWDIKKLPMWQLQDYKLWFGDIMKTVSSMSKRDDIFTRKQMYNITKLEQNYLTPAYYAVVSTAKKIS